MKLKTIPVSWRASPALPSSPGWSAQAERFGGCAGPGCHPLGRADRYGQDPDGASERLSGPRGHSASGATPRPIGCKNEEQYVGRGISYCATCDAGFFRNKAVYVAGSNSIAVEEALYLTGFAGR